MVLVSRSMFDIGRAILSEEVYDNSNKFVAILLVIGSSLKILAAMCALYEHS